MARTIKLTIFGATGRTGRHLVEQALMAGHEVTALVRDPAKLKLEHARLRVVRGDAHDVAQVAAAIAHADAVLSALGPTPGRSKDVMTVGLANIVETMKRQGVRRLIVSTGAGVPAPQDEPTVVHRFISVLLKLLAREVLEDSLRGIRTVRESDLDWTVARAPMLTDATAISRYRVGFVGREMGRKLSRANLADFMLKQIADETWLQQMPALSDARVNDADSAF